jgi:hypothetical protein
MKTTFGLCTSVCAETPANDLDDADATASTTQKQAALTTARRPPSQTLNSE